MRSRAPTSCGRRCTAARRARPRATSSRSSPPRAGSGKTTTAVNLALALADHGARKVCLVDLDLAFGDVAITMQLFPAHTIEEAIGAEDLLDFSMVEGLLTRHEESLMVLAAPACPDARDRVSASLVSRMLRTLKQEFDYVVVDTCPSFDELTLQALDETDECVIIATLDVPTLKNVKVAIETLDLLNIAIDHRHLVLNRADDAVGLDDSKVEQILVDAGDRADPDLDRGRRGDQLGHADRAQPTQPPRQPGVPRAGHDRCPPSSATPT